MLTYKNLIVKGDRKEIRDKLIIEFLREAPGTGKGELTSKYIYWVEWLSDGRRIFLKRPARLNKGMDFEINVENTYFGTKRKTTMPSHEDVLNDLIKKRSENPVDFGKVNNLIDILYKTNAIKDHELKLLYFDTGYTIEMLLKTIKWIFIEQDITYWNWSGRAMFYSALQDLKKS